MEKVGNGGEGGVEDRGNGAGAGYYVQGSRAVYVVTWEWELDGDRGHTQSDRGIQPLTRNKDYRDDGAEYDNLGVGVDPSGWRVGYLWDMSNQGVYTDKEENRSVAGGLLAHIWDVYGVRNDAVN